MRFFVTIILLVTALVNSKAESPTLLFSLSDSNIARIGVINDFDFRLKLKIVSDDGTVIFNQKIEQGDKFFKFYDLSELKSGKYFVELKGKGLEEKRTFIVQDGMATLQQDPDSKVPAIRIENNTLYVLMDNYNQQGISLTIRDRNTVLYQDLAIHDMEINKTIELNDFPLGEYTLTVKTEKTLYNYDFATN